MKFTKKTIFFVLLMLFGLVFWQIDIISYGWMQLSGGAKILLKAKPVEEILQDKSLPDTLKNRLKFIQKIRQFGIDSLGLSDTPNYQTFYDQQGKPLCFVLTVAEKYHLQVVPFSFPVIGSFEYKGFFDSTKAHLEAERWQGYDTEISPVSAYSTLGYFSDPILSEMLTMSDGRLANLILHELTHATVFVKDNHAFNENLANFVGDHGAALFLQKNLGEAALQRYEKGKKLRASRIVLLNNGAKKLDSLYKSFPPTLSIQKKDSLKNQTIRGIMVSMDTIYRRKNPLPNNAFFVGFATYNAKRNEFEDEFQQKFKGNLRAYLQYLKQKHGVLK